jgi:hypothetical protein
MKLDFINWVTEMHRKLIREIFPELGFWETTWTLARGKRVKWVVPSLETDCPDLEFCFHH